MVSTGPVSLAGGEKISPCSNTGASATAGAGVGVMRTGVLTGRGSGRTGCSGGGWVGGIGRASTGS